jgi:hypothetical protein
MKITFDKARDLIDSSKVFWGHKQIYYYNMADPDNFYFEIKDADDDYECCRSDNKSVEIYENMVILNTTNGDKLRLKLYFPAQLSSFCQEGDIV